MMLFLDTESSISHTPIKLWLALRERTGIWSQWMGTAFLIQLFNSFWVQMCFMIWGIAVLPRSSFVKLMRFLSSSTTFLVIGC